MSSRQKSKSKSKSKNQKNKRHSSTPTQSSWRKFLAFQTNRFHSKIPPKILTVINSLRNKEITPDKMRYMLMVILAFATGTISAYQIGTFITTRDMLKQQQIIDAAKEADATLATRIVNIKSFNDVKSISGRLFEMIDTTKVGWVLRFLFVVCLAAMTTNLNEYKTRLATTSTKLQTAESQSDQQNNELMNIFRDAIGPRHGVLGI